MTLSTDDMVRAGNAALRLLDLDGRVTPVPGPSWSGLPEDGAIEVAGAGWGETVHLLGDTPLLDAATQTADQISEYLSETDALWGVAFPRCPGHQHPASCESEGRDVVTRCPASGAQVARVTP